MKRCRLTELLQSLRDVAFPRCCPVCGRRMSRGETFCCTPCLTRLPYTGFRGTPGNPLERLFWGQFPVGKASAWFFYYRGSHSRNLILSLKYHNRRNLALPLGRAAARDLAESDFFDGIDAIVPVPLSTQRRRQRGYNVCDEIALGVAQVTHLPVWPHVVARMVDNPTQTRQLPFERWKKVQGIFAVTAPEQVAGRHLLLVEDVVTTGATVTSCASALAKASAARISVFSLAVSGTVTRTPPPTDDEA